MSEQLAVFETVVTQDDLKSEDGGCALILEIGQEGSDSFEDEDFVRLHSWREERIADHPEWMRQAVGKRIKVTITLEDL